MNFCIAKAGYGINPLNKTLEKLEIPICMLYGSKDFMFKRIPVGAHFSNTQIVQVKIKNASHQIHWDNPKALAYAMLDFLSRHGN